MSNIEMLITIVIAVMATLLTRFLPYILFPHSDSVPDTVIYLGKVLGPAVFGLLVVYCLKNVDFLHGSHGIAEILSVFVTIGIYSWRKNMMSPMLCGTLCYMILVRLL